MTADTESILDTASCPTDQQCSPNRGMSCLAEVSTSSISMPSARFLCLAAWQQTSRLFTSMRMRSTRPSTSCFGWRPPITTSRHWGSAAMAIAEILDEAYNWTPSSLTLPSLGISLVRLAKSQSAGGESVLEVRSQEVPRVIREANEIAERALAKDIVGRITTNTQSESHKIVWAPGGLFTSAGLGMAIASPDAESRRFTVQSTPISADQTPRILSLIPI